MIVNFGKHKGKSVATLVLKEPSYIFWVLCQKDPGGPLARVKAESKRLIQIFNSKPFTEKRCYGCKIQATRCTVYSSNVYGPMWWCNKCDPYQTGALTGKLESISAYIDALHHCDLYCSTKESMKNLIMTLAKAKGLPKRVGEKQANNFFMVEE